MENSINPTGLKQEILNLVRDNFAYCSSAKPITEISPEKQKEIDSKREFTAKFLAKNTDRAFAFLNSIIAHSDDVEEWKAEPEDLKDLTDSFLEMAQAYDWKGLPPWANTLMCILFTYCPAMKEAAEIRELNKKKKRFNLFNIFKRKSTKKN